MSEAAARLIEMEVSGLGVDTTSGSTVVMLEGGERSLAMVIGIAEATSIAKALGQVEMNRPLAHDLLRDVIDVVGAQLRQIEVVDLNEGTYYAELVLEDAEGNMTRIDSRPSDAIALALRAGAPIFVHEHVVPEEPRETQGLPSPTDKEGWKKVLDEMGPEDFKYKM